MKSEYQEFDAEEVMETICGLPAIGFNADFLTVRHGDSLPGALFKHLRWPAASYCRRSANTTATKTNPSCELSSLHWMWKPSNTSWKKRHASAQRAFAVCCFCGDGIFARVRRRKAAC